MLTVLPVPVGPVIKTCLSFVTRSSIRYVYRTVSIVGMIISANDSFASWW